MKFTSVRLAFRGIIMGPPGSGKGTVSKRITERYGLTHLSSGDILREEMELKTSPGVAAQEFIKSGKLVPDETMVQLILSKLMSLPENTSWLLDGFPRTVVQAEKLLEKQQVDQVINLDVPFDTICSRLAGRWTHLPSGRVYNVDFNPPKRKGYDDETGEALIQREDDKPETIKQRLESYQSKTLPLLDFFQEKGICTSYRGTKTDEIWPLIQDFLDSKVN